jgi:hypothetical protein
MTATDLHLGPLTRAQKAAAQKALILQYRQKRARVDRIERRRNLGQLEHYAANPAAWVTDSIDWPRRRAVAPYQLESLQTLADHHRLALRGPRGLGKTTTAALAVLWFALTREYLERDWKILTTAGVLRHLTRALWPEIHKWAPRVRGGLYLPPVVDKQLLTASLQMRHGQAYGAVAKNPDLIEGAHADEILILIDEAKSVPEAIWDALEGALTGEDGQYALALSTPGAPAGRFYEIHQGRHEDWAHRHVTPDEAIGAGRISRKWFDARSKGWGANSALFKQQALGDFAADDENAIVPLSWVEAAFERWHAWREVGRPERVEDVAADHPERDTWEAAGCPVTGGRRSYSVDVATAGADKTVIATRQGAHITRFDYTGSGSTMDTVAKVQGIIPEEHRPHRPVVVDVIGVGTGVADRLAELDYPVHRYVGSASTTATDASGEMGFNNVRSAAYWHLRELLSPDNPSPVILPPRQELIADLTTPTWKVITGSPSKYVMETKEDVVKRLGRSPDFGDAVAMAYWLDAMNVPLVVAPPSGKRLPRKNPTPGLGTVRK